MRGNLGIKTSLSGLGEVEAKGLGEISEEESAADRAKGAIRRKRQRSMPHSQLRESLPGPNQLPLVILWR